MRTISMEEFYDATETSLGWCTECECFTHETCEPDAEKYKCPDCEQKTCYGAEQANLMGLFILADEEGDDGDDGE